MDSPFPRTLRQWLRPTQKSHFWCLLILHKRDVSATAFTFWVVFRESTTRAYMYFFISNFITSRHCLLTCTWVHLRPSLPAHLTFSKTSDQSPYVCACFVFPWWVWLVSNSYPSLQVKKEWRTQCILAHKILASWHCIQLKRKSKAR